MYSYDSENSMYIFEGDLAKYLESHGISIEHINKMKNKILAGTADRDEYYDYPPLKSPESDIIDLVPLDKVIGTSRGSVGLSVYENVRTMHIGDREPGRFIGCLSFLNNLPLTELHKSYEKLDDDPVRMNYYVDEDIYFTTGNGNHRTLTAMLVGSKYIRAKVTYLHCNELKKKRFFCCKSFTTKYQISAIVNCGKNYSLYFNDNDGIYEISGYYRPKQEDCYCLINLFSELIDADIKRVDFITSKPKLIQKIILHFEKNHRICQYINRHYITDREFYLIQNNSVKLYNL